MEKKIVLSSILCMLLIFPSMALADWDPDDGHKMHFPQLPDPFGWDVDFHDWWLGDDWRCTETGPITDIHFWISWRMDELVEPIPWIKVWIYSDKPAPPYSQPLEELWYAEFDPSQFVIRGPELGDQGWFSPGSPEWFEHDHQEYYQVNIIDIEEPFEQIEDTIYWLVIQMPYFDYPVPSVGWKTSQDHWNDNAVWGSPGQWFELFDPMDGTVIDFAFVITGPPPPVPDLDCDGDIRWIDVKPGDTVSGNFIVQNIGDPGSLLNWNIISTPSWGNWTLTPSSGTGLPTGSPVTISVTVVAPNEENKNFTGEIKIVNVDDSTDICEIDVTLSTPVSYKSPFFQFFERIFERFPNAFPILRYLLGL